ncbi:MAG TPA: hypothetical protein VHX63_10445 [Acidobacteriaceae bacterium]|jgi:hypothetical protein|nr:hypothetical protein [Acidobacteriaceae bacterium]
MNRKTAETNALLALVMAVVLSALWPARAQDRKTSYPNMAPVDQYLMADRNAEIAMARSAAPEAISRDAKVLVLGRHGYETAVEGKNGFVCAVERSWMSPYASSQFWNPKIRGPICFNPAAARSVLPITYKRTELVLAGRSKAQMIAGVKDAIDKKEVPPLEPGAMTYMMSCESSIGNPLGHWVPHLMFYVPRTDGAAWGADLRDSPVLLSRQFDGGPEAVTVFMIPVLNWSDGTPAASGCGSGNQKHGTT